MRNYVQAALSGQASSCQDVRVQDVPARHDYPISEADKTSRLKSQAAATVYEYTNARSDALLECWNGGKLGYCKVDNCSRTIATEGAEPQANLRKGLEDAWLAHVKKRHSDAYAMCDLAVTKRKREESMHRRHVKKAAVAS